MRQEIINVIKESINNSPKVFFREQDIQMRIIDNLRKINNGNNNIFFEYNIKTESLQNYIWTKDKNIYIDIVVEIDSKFYPIEIKYKTISEEFYNYLLFGENNSFVKTENHGAINLGCYGLWKDIKRLELLKNKFNKVEQGIVLFVTNDKSYLVNPKSNSVGYAQFSLYDKREIKAGEFLNWNGELVIAKDRDGFQLDYSYKIIWEVLDTTQWNKKNSDIIHRYFIL